MKFYYTRYEISKAPREWTALRVKAAERAVRKEAEKMALFPEMRRFTSVDERMENMDARAMKIATRLRNARAKMWKEARIYLRGLPAEARELLLQKWNTKFMPGGPADLFAVARMMGLHFENELMGEK